jgi:hypothetical protein
VLEVKAQNRIIKPKTPAGQIRHGREMSAHVGKVAGEIVANLSHGTA